MKEERAERKAKEAALKPSHSTGDLRANKSPPHMRNREPLIRRAEGADGGPGLPRPPRARPRPGSVVASDAVSQLIATAARYHSRKEAEAEAGVEP